LKVEKQIILSASALDKSDSLKEEKKIKILSALDNASGSVAVGYLCKHCNIANPSDLSELLDELKEEGSIKCCPPNPWSLSLSPQYEITANGRQEVETKLLR